ncbi:MAG: cytochrome c oxidase assembly protein CtaG/Cox11-domain-containing protein [Benjaminiella poitrasii]|nr:MAG: cytochrome c oxidase assembly protein CtaG/Cox11-domain-containing protein [Benjaminiella poitrasii]
MYRNVLRSLHKPPPSLLKQPLIRPSTRPLYNNNTIHQRPQRRLYASSTTTKPESPKRDNVSGAMYTASIFIVMLGMSYAAVPLYRLFCSATGYSGTPVIDTARFGTDRLVPQTDRKRIRITFESNTSDALPWSFKPELREVYVVPGETALTFYKAKSKAKEDVIGIATYNVTPYRAGSYFNKIQCFCFEEQKLKPGEEVDMPVFFFIDPDFLEDPLMKDVNTITLSYTFFNSKYAKGLSPVQPAT